VFHTAADVLTVGLGSGCDPAEAIFSGDKVGFEVSYGEDDKIEKVVALEPSQPATP